MIAIFIVQKNQAAAVEASKLLRNLSQQSINLANAREIVWVGYSYFAFRIIHTLIDWRKNRQIETRLLDYLNYLLFFPSYLAGPISRFDYFMESYETDREAISAQEDLIPGMNRLIIGIFQKFIVSDFLYTFALNQNLADQISSRGWMWFSVLIYSLRLFFDFSGYTHIAIGLARIIGIRLPENFDKPFLAPTLTIFWNRWHITLTQWFRSYYFNPISRKIKRTYKSLDQRIILFFMQLTTMILIGFWHGINLNFVYWGIWTGAGLFLQNQISTFFKKKSNKGGYLWQKNPLIKAISTGLTFLYVSLGWVWFALPTVEQSLWVFKVLL